MQPKWRFVDKHPELVLLANDFLHRWEHNAHFEIKSSGTTSEPKTFRFTKDQLIHSAKLSIAAFGLNQHSRALMCLPLNSVGGLMLLARSLVGNFELYLQNPTSRPLEKIESTFDFVSMVPTQLQQSLTYDIKNLVNISNILIGGGAINTALIEACQKQKMNVWQSYGMSETLSHVALRKLSPTETLNYEALPGIKFSKVNDCLSIAYPEISEVPLQTTDIIELHSPTSFRWLGRADHAINSGGFKIIPELLENKLSSGINIPFYIAGLADEKWGEIVVLVLETYNSPDLTFLKQMGLPTHEIPKKYAVIPTFIRTTTGKVKRSETSKLIQIEHWRSI